MTLALALAEAAELVQAGFDDLLEARAGVPVRDAMLYAVRGGKRLRGFLVLESARLHGVGPERAIHAALAVEALHAYSLVHDDLPCMDDDDLRRGQPTVHKVWDEATAVLAGDALQTFAFECLTHTDLGSPEIRIDLVASLSRASGIDGMVLGQAQDMAAESAGLTPNVASVTELQANKTGALSRARMLFRGAPADARSRAWLAMPMVARPCRMGRSKPASPFWRRVETSPIGSRRKCMT